MKTYLIIIGLFLLTINRSNALQNTYISQPVIYPSYYNQGAILRPVYNPYGNYYYNQNQRRVNPRKIRTINRIRRLNNTLRRYGNYLSWLGNKNNSGALTGYSTPITNDIYQQMGISPYNPKNPVKQKSPTCNTDLFSSPQGNEMYYTNGEFRKELSGASGKTGVTIIYD